MTETNTEEDLDNLLGRKTMKLGIINLLTQKMKWVKGRENDKIKDND